MEGRRRVKGWGNKRERVGGGEELQGRWERKEGQKVGEIKNERGKERECSN